MCEVTKVVVYSNNEALVPKVGIGNKSLIE